nr:hypothetical protein [Acidimicrobiia bacterium]
MVEPRHDADEHPDDMVLDEEQIRADERARVEQELRWSDEQRGAGDAHADGLEAGAEPNASVHDTPVDDGPVV